MENMTDIEAAMILQQFLENMNLDKRAGVGKQEIKQAFARAIEKLEECNTVEPEAKTKPAAIFGTTGADLPAEFQKILTDIEMIKRALFGPEYITYTKDLKNDYKENEEMYRREYMGIFSPEAIKATDAELLQREQTDDYRPRHEIVIHDLEIQRIQERGDCPQLMTEIEIQYTARERDPRTKEQHRKAISNGKTYRISETAWNEFTRAMDPGKAKE